MLSSSGHPHDPIATFPNRDPQPPPFTFTIRRALRALTLAHFSLVIKTYFILILLALIDKYLDMINYSHLRSII